MITDTEGIILKQVKTVNGRTMLVMFSRKFGKISVGTNLTGAGKNKSSLTRATSAKAIRPSSRNSCKVLPRVRNMCWN